MTPRRRRKTRAAPNAPLSPAPPAKSSYVTVSPYSVASRLSAAKGNTGCAPGARRNPSTRHSRCPSVSSPSAGAACTGTTARGLAAESSGAASSGAASSASIGVGAPAGCRGGEGVGTGCACLAKRRRGRRAGEAGGGAGWRGGPDAPSAGPAASASFAARSARLCSFHAARGAVRQAAAVTSGPTVRRSHAAQRERTTCEAPQIEAQRDRLAPAAPAHPRASPP